ncbi:MAG TPA: type IV secretion system DNA-binding domain-containing protein [Solirubrobacteraceae bacterium]|nr:type IV secretion system DNA-binding domain-containing protein [Solirubrobacteraceae bacterium]
MQPHGHPLSPSLAPLLAPMQELFSVFCHVGAGVAVGSLVVTAMRRHDLCWTWSLPALVLELPVHPLIGGWYYTLLTATGCAAARGRRRHREDLAWGGDLAEWAQARRGPLLFAHEALIALREHSVQGVSPAQARVAGRLAADRIAIGRDERTRVVSIPLGAGGGRHTLVLGATGSGKTVTQTWILCSAIEAGLGAVVIDPKGDPRMREQLAAAASQCGREFVKWTPAGPNVYNPFGHGSASEIADRALAGERFTEPHYQRQAQRYLGYAVRALRCAEITVSLSELVDQLDPTSLEELAQRLPRKQADATTHYLTRLSARQRSDLSGVRDRLAILAESDLAQWLDPATPGQIVFDLLSAMRRRAVVYFALEVDSWPLLARMLAAAIVGDVRGAMSALQHSPVPTVVAIDEFAAVAADQVAHLFGRARSAGISLLLGTQELSDLRLDERVQLRDQVLGNLSSLIAHRQVVCESAELVANLAGSRGVWRTSQTAVGGWTRSRSSAALLAPERIRSLAAGEAAVLDLAASTTSIAHVFSRRAR